MITRYCTTKHKDGMPYGKAKVAYGWRGKQYKNIDKLLKAINEYDNGEQQ